MPDSPENERMAKTTVSSDGDRQDMVGILPNGSHVALNGQFERPVDQKVTGVLVRGNVPPDNTDPAGLRDWSETAAEARQQALAEILRAYLESRQCPAGSVVLVALENDVLGRPVRAICSFMPGCVQSDDSLPRFIRSLERHVRTILEVPIEVLADEEKDRNKLRQLIVIAKSGEARG